MDVITKDSDVSAATVNSQVSSTLPTLNTVNLTSGADTVTPTANAAEEITLLWVELLHLWEEPIRLTVVALKTLLMLRWTVISFLGFQFGVT